MARGRRVLALGTLVCCTLVARAPPGVAASDIQVRARIAGRSLATADANDPLALRPGARPIVHVQVQNDTTKPITVRSVRVQGRVMGLAFFSYLTGAALRVEANDRATFSYRLDLVGLDGQATGLIPATLAVLDRDGDVLADQSFTADVRGSIASVYGLFGLAVLVFTALTLAAALIALARGRLPRSRVRRALWFMVPGLGAGLTLTFSLSALRLVTPSATAWVPLVLGVGAAGFVVGYLTPAPADATLDDEEDLVGEEAEDVDEDGEEEDEGGGAAEDAARVRRDSHHASAAPGMPSAAPAPSSPEQST